ncbi:polysaccharide deacetylase family protein [Marinibaculum pumilum]|uniref:Chitooligosaccharide deacetylase n=1 Tax=Marinibaculum pumilum TaxID=1766165 RepID=A0ABV7L602_9PROT
MAPPAGAAAIPGTAKQPADAVHAVILLYHRFGGAGHPETNVRVAQLDAQIAALQAGGHRVLPVAEIAAALRAGHKLPPRTVGITVDDGSRTFAETAWPRFRAAGFPVTLFVSPDAADRPGHAFLGWAALERLAAEGVAIGNHSLSHRHLAGMDDAALRRQVLDAQAILSDRLGAAPALFAYPYGEWSPPVRKLVGDAGFTAAFGQQSGVAWAGGDLLTLPRFPINERYGTPDRFALVTNALPLPLTDLEPFDPVVTGANPPRLRFTLAAGLGPLDGLACYASHVTGPVPLRPIGPRRFEVMLPGPLPPGRTRINCTLPAAGAGAGRWRWFGMQLQVPAGPPPTLAEGR